MRCSTEGSASTARSSVTGRGSASVAPRSDSSTEVPGSPGEQQQGDGNPQFAGVPAVDRRDRDAALDPGLGRGRARQHVVHMQVVPLLQANPDAGAQRPAVPVAGEFIGVQIGAVGVERLEDAPHRSVHQERRVHRLQVLVADEHQGAVEHLERLVGGLLGNRPGRRTVSARNRYDPRGPHGDDHRSGHQGAGNPPRPPGRPVRKPARGFHCAWDQDPDTWNSIVSVTDCPLPASRTVISAM